MTRQHRVFQVALATILASLLALSNANAQDNGFTGATGDWNVATNWLTGAVPDSSNPNVHVGSVILGGSAAVSDVTIVGAPLNNTIGELRIGAGNGTNGVLNQSSGTLTSNGWTFIGLDANNTPGMGTFNLSGGDFISADAMILGVGGGMGTNTGVLNVSGGTFTANSGFSIGRNDNNTGIVNQTGGTVTANNWLAIGNEGATGSYNISAGSLIATNPNNAISVGDNFGQANTGNTSQGTLNISGSASVTATSSIGIVVGDNLGATGNLNIDGSSAAINVNNLQAATDFDPMTSTATDVDAIAILSWTSDASDVSPVVVNGATVLNDGTSMTGTSDLMVDLTQHAAFSSFGSGTTPIEFVLVDNLVASSVGTFDSLPEGSVISIGGGQTGVLSYVGGADALDVTVTVLVPEPGALAFLSMFVAGLAIWRRRK